VTYSTLVSTETLATRLGGSWVVVDCRYDLRNADWGREQYLASHVPGAVYASLSHDLAGPVGGGTGRHPLPSPSAMEATFGRLGIAPGVQVVAYDQDNGLFASRLWWMLRYMGHDAAAVLDGGWAKWTREQRPVHTGEELNSPHGFTGRVRPELLAGLHDVQARLGDPSLRLVDARAPERFEGASEPLDRAPGHIPGAANYFYKRNVTDDGVMLPAETLRRQFAEVIGERSPADVVMYCGSGVSACQNLLALEHAGVSGVKLYPGSWSEWSSDPQRPVETGPARLTTKPS
jgi:thiosulfate/3-mercaptopyruvate sulfurtransferase